MTLYLSTCRFSTTSDNKITVNLFDSIDVYCPYYPPMSDNSTWEYYVIYLVSILNIKFMPAHPSIKTMLF